MAAFNIYYSLIFVVDSNSFTAYVGSVYVPYKPRLAIWRPMHQLEWRNNQHVTEIKLKRGESVDRALRRLKKKMDKEGTMKEIRNHRYFEKPSEKRRRKSVRSRFS